MALDGSEQHLMLCPTPFRLISQTENNKKRKSTEVISDLHIHDQQHQFHSLGPKQRSPIASIVITIFLDCRIWIVVMSDSEATLKPSPRVVRSSDYHNLVSKTSATVCVSATATSLTTIKTEVEFNNFNRLSHQGFGQQSYWDDRFKEEQERTYIFLDTPSVSGTPVQGIKCTLRMEF